MDVNTSFLGGIAMEVVWMIILAFGKINGVPQDH